MEKFLIYPLLGILLIFMPIRATCGVDIDHAEEDLAFALGTQAYIFGYPLAITAATTLIATNTDSPLPNAYAPFNQFGHVAKLFTAEDKDVVSSNVDTVYSSAFIDLKQGAALISVPGTGDRYYSMMLEDAYTNVFGYIGSRATGNEPGKYLIKGPNWEGRVPVDVNKVITAPTALVWVIGRTLVEDEADLVNVKKIQAGYQLEMIGPAVDKTPAKKRWSLGDPGKIPVKMVEQLTWQDYYYWIGQLMKDNPPPTADSGLYVQFKSIGLTAETGFNPESLSDAARKGLERGYHAGKRVVKREALKTGATEVNAWAYNMSQGKWEQDFNLRAAIAFRSLGQNTPEEALYFNTRTTGKKEQLNGANRYTITFKKDELPPVDAFWSITMYNAENFFVDNPINRYAIGDRTKGLKIAGDGSLTIYIQNPAPEEAQNSNWLPAPTGDFRLSLRLYNPKQSVLNGDWKPAPVKIKE
ncbi:DUF1254 domain-containing protein [Desulfosarcina ovata]|uniref:Phosphatidylserine decarboxylase n=1 Tax=Desulfosarcina ovata subsp. ovata TaxID=2752305 RepID=A0A5K8ADS4_9BACT|nr:DUF1254 domain-containing protein [Desulfosarcina ovata]BBO90727.1 phosphatidylserine decarboxylase [Desulfosarcina ovata subsp. ovata]